MKYNTIICDDSVSALKQLDANSVDLVVTSPPYGNLRKYRGYSWDFEKTAEELVRVLKEGGVIVWVSSDETIKGSESCVSFKQVLYFRELGLNLYDTMIWRKPNPAVPTEGRYYNAFEYMFVLSKGKPKTFNPICDRPNKTAGGRYRSDSHMNPEVRQKSSKIKTVGKYSRRHNVWDIAVGSNKTGHPAVFPMSLARDHILSWSNEGDLVLDPFVGSGTTAVMAAKLNRRYIGIDISEEYCLMTNYRIKQLKEE